MRVENEKLRVLIVDDNVNAAVALEAYFSYENFEPRSVFGGRAAIEMSTEWRPHVILMDISMPGCNGFDAALALRKNSLTRDIAIVAFTALDESEVRRHLSDHEFDAYYQKGQPPSNLTSLIYSLAAPA